MRKETKAERAAWTEHFLGGKQVKPSKYKAVRTEGYASKRERDVAAKLWALERAGKISGLCEQVPFVLVEGKGKVRGIKYVADFTYTEDGRQIVADAKGCCTPVYILKRKLMFLLLGITVLEL